MANAMKAAVVQTKTRRMRIWVGDVLEGREGKHVARVTVTYLGNGGDLIVVRDARDGYEAPWTLSCRDWKVVKRSPTRGVRVHQR